ncbi:hypothetical protein PHPALM_30845 [Phytophthora palmivora]|uniref:Uncharacterized protein n=1 Tax=Phytophthora palmivora TaxID=4796 RepID=A0A2P4X441_9STRA|nr:hypothetical protein PHPALM_30845 [Phytophthora palmivora]
MVLTLLICSLDATYVREFAFTTNTPAILHELWKNGAERPPPRVGRDIQMRLLGKKCRRNNSQIDVDEVAVDDQYEVEEEVIENDDADERAVALMHVYDVPSQISGPIATGTLFFSRKA